MRVRNRILLATSGLLLAALVGMAVLATGLMSQAVDVMVIEGAGDVAGDVVGDVAGDVAEQWLAAVQAAVRVLWLGAAALAAVLLGVATVLTRSYLVADLELLERQVTRDEDVAEGDEIQRLQARFTALRSQLRRLEGAQSAGLVAVSDYRDAMHHVAEQLAVADRLALTGQLSLGVAHEIGGPLSVAQAAVDTLPLLDGPNDGDERSQTLADLQLSIERIDAILRDMNDFGLQRGTSGEGAAASHADVAAVVAHVQRLGQIHPRVRHVTLELDDARSVEQTTVAMSPGRLEQVLLNLVVNAADATDGKGRARITWVRDTSSRNTSSRNTSSRDEGRVQIDIEDDGPGIAAEQRERIFEPFVTSKAPGAGSGLGLAVSRRLVEAAGGTLVATTSDELGGALLRVELPSARPPSSP